MRLTSGFADVAEDEAAAGLDIRQLHKPTSGPI